MTDDFALRFQIEWRNFNGILQIVDQLPKEERALLTKDKTFVIPNVLEESRMFEWAGVSFGEEETYKL